MANGVSIVEMGVGPQKVQCSQLNETVSAEPSSRNIESGAVHNLQETQSQSRKILIDNSLSMPAKRVRDSHLSQPDPRIPFGILQEY